MFEVDLWKLGTDEAQLWETRQIILASEIYYTRVLPLIKDIADNQHLKQLSALMGKLIRMSFPKLIKGRADNPVHHSFQVLENMLNVIRSDFRKPVNLNQVKTLIAISFLHDIGDAEVTGEKVTTSQIRDAIKEKRPKEEIKEIVQKAINFRNEHMEKGAQMTRRILTEHLQEDFSTAQIDDICNVIKIHDNPTIAFILDEFTEFAQGGTIEDYLFFTPEDEIAILLREVDRMWMVSKEGLEKDLMDKVVKKKKPKSPQEQLAYNLKRFREERVLYDNAQGNFGKFQQDTFFRNNGSFEFFKRLLRQWREFPQMRGCQELKEIFSKYLGSQN